MRNKHYSLILIFLFVIQNAVFGQTWDKIEAKDFQENMNIEFADSTQSPLKKKDLASFKALDFFPLNEKFAVKATFKRTKKTKKFQMPTTTSRKPWYQKYGEIHFEIDGKKFQLSVYQSLDLIKKPGYEDYLFIPFTDLTSGNESYGGGRYLDFKIPKTKEIILDFNKSYNPYCAYNEKYSCPIPPVENDLQIAIEAGVKSFKK